MIPGTFSMRSDLSAKQKAQESLEGSVSVTEEYFYDTYKLNLSRMCAFTVPELRSWRSRSELKDQHLLPAFDVNLALSVRTVSVSSLPQIMYDQSFVQY
jgi:hypothetical protein